MTLPASGNISMLDIYNELKAANPNRTLPIGLGDADVRALAGVPSGAIAMSQLYGKSSVAPLSATGNNDSGFEFSNAGAGSVYAYPSVSYSGGSGAKSFQWSVLSSTGTATLSNATQQQCTVSRGFTKNSSGRVIAYLRCVVTDDTGSVTVDNIVADLNWESA